MVTAKQLRSRAYRKGHLGKAIYRDEQAAIAAVLEQRRRLVLSFGEVQIDYYPCRFGKHYHVGHKLIIDEEDLW